MKKRYFFTTLSIAFFLFLFSGFHSLNAQDKECATVMPPNYQSEKSKNPKAYQEFLRKFQQESQNRSTTSSCINYAPIKAHIVRTSAGTGGLSEADLNSAIATMNAFYANSCMAYYLCGAINYIDNDTYYNFDTSDEAAMTGANNVPDLINIYFCNSVSSGSSSYCGYAYFPGGPDVILMNNSCTMNGSTLSHELGHFFALPHTHSGGDELVDGSNCTTAGDDFCDTPADPQIGNSTVNSSCVYTGTATDANGDAYMPNTRNVMSYSRKSCRTEFSPEQYAMMSFTFLNVRNYWNCTDFQVDFVANAVSSCSVPFTVNFTEICDGETSYEWDFENDGIVDATTPNPSHTYPTAGSYDVSLKISNGVLDITEIKTAYINVGANSFPYDQSMDGFTANTNASGYADNWTTSPSNTTSAYRWNITDLETPSNNTGPDGDHTQANGSGNGAGLYIFSEATGASTGDVAELVSPCLDVSVLASTPSIRFWYHMYGSNMGSLHIDLFDGTTWVNDITTPIIGEQQTASSDLFLEKIFDVSAYKGSAIQIRFRAVRGNGFRSDMAIDDFEIFDNLTVLPVELSAFTGKIMEDRSHLLRWETATEVNSDYFLLEHSADGVRFESLEKIAAQGQSFEQQTYDYRHLQPKNGVNYYRLKMVDWDGSVEYSSIVSLERIQEEKDGISIFPNPGKGWYQLERNNQNGSLRYQVFNTVGQKLQEGQWDNREKVLSLDLSERENGLYIVLVRDGEQLLSSHRLIKQ